jgi:hypothetical protein
MRAKHGFAPTQECYTTVMDRCTAHTWMLSVLFVLLVIPVVLASCLLHPGKGSMEYPPSWPLPQITAPPGSSQATVFNTLNDPHQDPRWMDGHPFKPGTPYACKMWGLAFQTSLDWSGIIKHFDEELKPLNYLLSKRMMDSGPQQIRETQYVNTELTSIIRVFESPAGVFNIQIKIYDSPQQRFQQLHMQPIP